MKRILAFFLFAAAISSCANTQRPSQRVDKRSSTEASERSSRTAGYDADDSGLNVRDEGSSLVPTDQVKGSTRDVEITRRIRALITAQDGLSINAQNIKIITLQGTTTLRGPVNSVAEKAKVVGLARQVAGRNSVRNQLEVTQD